ncbi:MAG: penicillin-binding protein 2 [Tenacibaculum sp.]|nr:penicillin-binding protein 2 [Tenacibaculum sp.]
MKKGFLLVFSIILVGLIFIGRLFYLQIIKHGNKNPIESATVKIEYDYPERGYIYDRKGRLLVANQLSYDVMVIPKEVMPLDTLEFCSLLKIDKENFKKRINKAINYATYRPSVFLKQLAKEDYAVLQEKLNKFKGFYIQKRIIRNYPVKSAANVLGYISEVNERVAKNSDYYEQGELIGWWGVEKQYEKVLRGVKGKKYFSRDNLNRITGVYKKGKYDTLAVAGKDLTLTIDIELQKYGEVLMKGKRGGIVAIEPKTGEILALVTAPSYDPNMLVGRKRRVNSLRLFNDTINKPMIDRGLQGAYPPGSPFKIVNGLIGLQEGVINEKFSVYCNGGYKYGRNKRAFMGCHCGIYGRPVRLREAIAKSCNSYFATVYRKIIDNSQTARKGMDIWSNHVKSFGLGNFLGYDLPVGQKGLIPDSKLYDRFYRNFKWGATTSISNAIGQGEVSTTPIQLANVTAAIANKGYYYTPHIVKKIQNELIKDTLYTKQKNTNINSTYFNEVIEAMHDVFKTGTGRYSQVKGIDICGKTGTSENYIRVNGSKIKLEDHSILIAFAPKNDPKIALAVFVENGGYGSTIAAPITSLLIEKYINGEVLRKHVEERMINLSLEHIYDKQIKKIDSIETRR